MTTTTATRPVTVGDFFVSSWGYDQTNIDFYRVIAVSASGKTVKVQHWKSTTRPAGVGQDWCAPGNGPMTGRWVKDPDAEHGSRYDADAEYPVKSHRLRTSTWSSEPQTYFTVNSYSAAYLWDGDAQYQTALGYGH
jgi:hypothetical protein